ncbi:MAG TPA: hypothetical protein VIX82_02995, partial [Solirubrobacteraceae bacterium]
MEQACDQTWVTGQAKVGDAWVIGKTKAIAAHALPNPHGIVGYVLLIAVAWEIEETRRRGINDL